MRMKSIGKSAAAAFVLVAGLTLAAEPVVQCEFQQGKWSPDDFLGVKSSRWVFTGHFIQEKDHLKDGTPPPPPTLSGTVPQSRRLRNLQGVR